MIIYTEPNIKKLKPKRISYLDNYLGSESCLAEVEDDFSLSEDEMRELDIDFWWKLSGGYFAHEDYDYDYYEEIGLLHGVMETYQISKENNIAMAMFEVTENIGEDSIDYWNRCLEENDEYKGYLKLQKQ